MFDKSTKVDTCMKRHALPEYSIPSADYSRLVRLRSQAGDILYHLMLHKESLAEPIMIKMLFEKAIIPWTCGIGLVSTGGVRK